MAVQAVEIAIFLSSSKGISFDNTQYIGELRKLTLRILSITREVFKDL